MDTHASLLDRIGVLRHPSDLDLLIFFARHPRALLASEHLAGFLGYGTTEIAASLDLLVAAGVVTRTLSHRHSARMFVLAEPGSDLTWFPDLLKVATTREGRLALLSALRARPAGGNGATNRAGRRSTAAGRTRPFLVRKKPARRTKTG